MGKTKSKPTQKNQLKETHFKILLLGTGKSTLFKQIASIHSSIEYTSEEILSYKSSIYSNVLNTMYHLCSYCIKKDDFDTKEKLKDAKAIVDLCEDYHSLLINAYKLYTLEVHKIIGELWKEVNIQEAFLNHRYDYHIFDGAEYFFNQFSKLEPPNYIPSFEDMLRCQRKTTGLIQTSFTLDDIHFTIFDVGGQRSERRKWSNIYESTNGMIFIASLSEYDQKCYEDDVTNRMNEAMEAFEETINNTYFKEMPIVLLLNKDDIFRKKIQVQDLTCVFQDYEGGCNYKNGVKFIKSKYQALNKGSKERLHIHTCSATIKDEIDQLFRLIKKDLISLKIGDPF